MDCRISLKFGTFISYVSPQAGQWLKFTYLEEIQDGEQFPKFSIFKSLYLSQEYFNLPEIRYVGAVSAQ